MAQAPSFRAERKQEQSGQVLIEYMLMMLVALTFVIGLMEGLRQIRDQVWVQVSCDVIAACPSCDVPEGVKAQANQMAPGACE